MNSRYLLIAIVTLVIIGGGAVFLASRSYNTPLTPSPTNNNSQSVGGGPGNINDQTQVKSFRVEGKPFSFTVVEENGNPKTDQGNDIKVKQGDRVIITFVNTEGFHDLVIDEFNARTKQIQAGQSETIDFVADKKGSFKYYCSVGGTDPQTSHRLKGMVGNFIVE